MNYKKKLKTIVALSFVLTVFTLGLSFAIQKAPLTGHTYRIAEPNLWTEIEHREQEAIPKLEARVRALRKQVYKRPKNWTIYLPPAKHSYKYHVSMEYTLKHNIPEVNYQGQIVGILYPKGYRFNILHHLKVMPPTLIVFDAKIPAQVKLALEYAKDYPYSMLITVDGDAIKLGQKLHRQIFYLPKNLNKRLKLRNTLSLVFWNKQKGYETVIVRAVHNGK